MPGWVDANSPTQTWMPCSSLTLEKKPDPSQPIVYAPIAKNAT
jgi:hypothetical protein